MNVCDEFLRNPSIDPLTDKPIDAARYKLLAESCGLNYIANAGIDHLTDLIYRNVPPTQTNTQTRTVDTTGEWTPYYFYQLLWRGQFQNVEEKIKPLLKEIVNKQNSRGQTPIYLAARNGNREVVEVLLKAGADINLPNATASGDTAVHGAAWGKGTNNKYVTIPDKLDFIKFLVERGANVCATNKFGDTIVSLMCAK